MTIELWGERFTISNQGWSGGDELNRRYLQAVADRLEGAAIMGPDMDHAIARNVIKEISEGAIAGYNEPGDLPGDDVII